MPEKEYIEREAFLNKLQSIPVLQNNPILLELCCEWVKAEPAADVRENVRGEWQDGLCGDMPVQICSCCNTFFPLAYTGGGHRFCPECGADMREKERIESEV